MPPGTIVSLRFHLERKGVRCTVREQGAAGDFRVSESAEVGQLLIELCAQLSSEPTKLVSTTGKLPPGSRPSAAPRSGQRPSAGGGGPCLGAQARSQMHLEAVLGYAQVEASSANGTCLVPMGVGNRRVVYETAGMGASAPRITALLESLRARRPSGLPADDALERRRRSGPRAAGRVQRGGASAADRRWVYWRRWRSKGGVGPWRWRAGVRLAKLVPDHRRSFLFSSSRLALRDMNFSRARYFSSCSLWSSSKTPCRTQHTGVLRSGGGLRM